VFVSDLLNCLEKHGGNTLPTVGLRDNDIMDINEPTAFKRREAEKTIDQPDWPLQTFLVSQNAKGGRKPSQPLRQSV
jgi:hypothetical protein